MKVLNPNEASFWDKSKIHAMDASGIKSKSHGLATGFGPISGFEHIIDQERPLRILTAILQSGRTPHALLFTGMDGVGKQKCAETFAMALNCIAGSKNEEYTATGFGPCLNCRSCRKIQTTSHPDIIHVQPSGSFIKVDQIRVLCRTLSLKPYEAKQRVVIISGAHTMNPSAANALLKVLEEPPDQTTLLLIALTASGLIPTIVSRCQQIRFNPISRNNLKRFLLEKEKMRPDDATILAGLAQGSFSRARSLSRTNWINRRKWLIHMMEKALEKSVGQTSGAVPVDPISFKSLGFLLVFAERLSKNKGRIGESLEIIKSWLRDLLVCQHHPDKVINADFIETIKLISQKTKAASLILKIEAIGEAEKDIQANVNLRLILEILMLRIAAE
ncbi:DNA polymerase III subunit delta' [Thermodesulfobacteriota bacterium]